MMTRRVAMGALLGTPAVWAQRRPVMRVREWRCEFEDHLYRTPYKFGAATVDRVTLLNVHCTVEGADGKRAQGFGSMPLGNAWSFPSTQHTYAETLVAMREMAKAFESRAAGVKTSGHPMDLGTQLESEFLAAAKDVEKRLELREAIPKLCVLVTGSPFDAALHDAYGKMLGLNCYQTYSAKHMSHDLAAWLGIEYKGQYPNAYLHAKPQPYVWLYHSVGAGDPISLSDVTERLKDGMPQTLAEWTRYSGLTHFKIKLSGADMAADLERTINIHNVVSEVLSAAQREQLNYCVDFNERCPNVDALIEYLAKLKERIPDGFERIQYVEQPTRRDLRADRANAMHKANQLRPIVVDEALTDVESLELAQQMGYNGAALKACKGQTQVLLMSAAAARKGMFLCVQDLTCPGAAFIHSAGIAAHVKGVSAIEANAREYVPLANRGWTTKFPGVFDVRNGRINTALLTRPGLSAV